MASNNINFCRHNQCIVSDKHHLSLKYWYTLSQFNSSLIQSRLTQQRPQSWASTWTTQSGFKCTDIIIIVTTQITEPWTSPEFLYCDHTCFLLLTCPHSSVLLSVVSSHSQLNCLDKVQWISLNHSMTVDRYKFIYPLPLNGLG